MPVHRLVPSVLLCVVISLVTLAHPTNKAASGKAAQARKSGPESEIRAVLDAQVAAWNAGKIEEFMKGYWRSPELTFFQAAPDCQAGKQRLNVTAKITSLKVVKWDTCNSRSMTSLRQVVTQPLSEAVMN